MSKKYTRKDLIKICEQAFVSEDKWGNRDTAQAQIQLGKCYAFLKDGCDYKILYDNKVCKTDEHTIWVTFFVKDFLYFEMEGSKEEYTCYLPTQKRLDEANGEDWY